MTQLPRESYAMRHPDAPAFHVHGEHFHICAYGPVAQSTIDALLLAAKGLTTPGVDKET